jgi:hypothetical protein
MDQCILQKLRKLVSTNKSTEDVVALRQLLSVVSNGLQRNAVVVDKLKHEMNQVSHTYIGTTLVV